ncbi:MAG: glycosyltransferase family 4 protein [Candidatus Cohnella colombiensis]|uniref:Glycosyltransferase family 4 protein n=1 Tax=Candidatus Cohnella colombiensis TaxID=3121368 RepID=A0AA95JC89_9BACL|nr:MAG: glycosyltransferase family 4 protein [Cohnella sp.]
MKLCIVTHKLLKGDGQARVNYEIVSDMLQRGHEVTVCASSVAPELLARSNLIWRKVPVKGWPTQLLKNQVFAVLSTFQLLRLRQHYDVLMVNGFITWLKSDINAVHFVHSSWIKSPAHPFKLKKNLFGWYQLSFTLLNSLLERVAFARTSQLVPVSHKVKNEIQAVTARGNPNVIMNGVDVTEFHPDQNVSRERWELPENVPLALFAGDIKSSRKNLDSVLKAMQDVKELHLAVAGETQGSPYVKLAEQLGLSERVHFLGFRKDLSELMKCVDFFVFPSRYEACTLVVIEALASGLPVITTYESGVSELIEMEAGFILHHPEDVAGLATAMKRLATNAELRSVQGKKAREVAERHSWSTVAAAYMQLFEKVSAEKKRGSYGAI